LQITLACSPLCYSAVDAIVAGECIRYCAGHWSESTTMSRPYNEMTRREKVIFVLKLAACILSFGFIYPNIMND
jgi:hypothetical protein